MVFVTDSKPQESKTQVMVECLQPDVSIAGVALANGLNANLLRTSVQAHRDRQACGEPARLGREARAADDVLVAGHGSLSKGNGLITLDNPFGSRHDAPMRRLFLQLRQP